MRKLGKITSFLIVFAMFACLLPAKTAMAERRRVELGETKATVTDNMVLDVGDVKDLNFYGAYDYVYKKDNGSVYWKSSDSKVVSVDRKTGVINAVAPGTATISMTVSASATHRNYEGSVKITVRENDVKIKIAAYDRVTITYPSAEDAYTACQKGISLQRIRRYNSGNPIKSIIIPKVSIDVEDKRIINVETNFNNGDDYVFFAEGLDANGVEIHVAWDKVPAYATLAYSNAYLSENGGRDITGTKSLSSCDATPVFELYDCNDIVIGRALNGGSFVGATGVSGSLTYYKKSSTGSASLKSVTSGVVRMTKLDQNAVMYAIWKSNDKKTEIKTPEVTVTPEEYVLPDLGPFVEGIVATTKTGNDVNWSGSESCKARVPASTSTSILFYFLADDGKKYSGNADAYRADDIYQLNTTDYRFVYKLTPESEKYATVSTKGKLQTYREGNITVEIYLCEKGKSTWSVNAQYVGQLDILITEEPEIFDLDVEDYILVVDPDDLETGQVITAIGNKFTVLDQYGEPFRFTSHGLTITAEQSGSPTATISWNSDSAGGKINFNCSNKPAGTYNYTIKYRDIIDTQVQLIIQ